MDDTRVFNPESRHDSERESLRKLTEFLARLLDTAIPIPGTRFRIGFDPLIGLVPGIGDALASLIGSIILLLAVRIGVPKITIIRMGLNVLLNGTIGMVPGLGDLFSAWYRSNVRNVDLLLHASGPAFRSTVSDWVFVLVVLTIMLSLLGFVLIGILWVLIRLQRLIQ
jgi:hypothetical protein